MAVLFPRLAWMLYYDEVQNANLVCEKFRITRKTFYKWRKRFRRWGQTERGLGDRSRRPYHMPTRIPVEMREAIFVAKEEHPDWGQRRIRRLLLERGIVLSERTIWKYLKNGGLVADGYRPID